MTKLEMTEAIVMAKQAKQASWSSIAQAAGLSEVYTTSACLGMNHLDKDAADKLVSFLALSDEVSLALQAFPHKSWDKLVPTDPLIYRLYEIVGV